MEPESIPDPIMEEPKETKSEVKEPEPAVVPAAAEKEVNNTKAVSEMCMTGMALPTEKVRARIH